MVKLAITANLSKNKVRTLVPEVLDWLDRRACQVVVEEDLGLTLNLPDKYQRVAGEALAEHNDMVLSFGGDGTILSTARKVGAAGTPILGVKIGGMGFLAEVSPDGLFDSLDKILQGKYKVVERMVLEANIDGEEPLFALNDFVFDKGATPRVIQLQTSINDEFLNTYIGDGLIISTPTGSTAYSLAAGGPILLPSMQAIIINPISPHTLGARPVVIPGNKVVQIKVGFSAQSVLLSSDGQVARELERDARIAIRKAKHAVRLVSYDKRTFHDVLRAKLNWGEDVRKGTGTTQE